MMVQPFTSRSIQTWIRGTSANTSGDSGTLCSPRNIDLLSIDIEGYELECLESFDFETYSFEVIVVESYNHDETQGFFARRGYRLSDDFSHNLIFVRDKE